MACRDGSGGGGTEVQVVSGEGDASSIEKRLRVAEALALFREDELTSLQARVEKAHLT